MSKLLGANWQTTIYGSLFALCVAIAGNPESVAFLPDGLEGYVRGTSSLIALAAGVKFAVEAKARRVTGGTVQQTTDGSEASRNAQEQSSAVLDTKTALPKA